MGTLWNYLSEGFVIFYLVMVRVSLLMLTRRIEDGIVVVSVAMLVGVFVVFLSARLVEKKQPGYWKATGQTFLVMMAAVGLISLVMGLPRIDHAGRPAMIVLTGAPLFAFFVSCAAAASIYLKKRSRPAGLVAMVVVGVLFSAGLLATFGIFVYGAYNY